MMRRASYALRAASIVVALQYSIHAILFLAAGPRGRDLGYGLMVILAGLVEAAVLWLVARLVQGDRRVLVIAWVFIVANIGHAVLAPLFFFSLPAVFDAAVVACLIGACVAARAPSTASR